jgi:hypothetical protein
MQTMSKRFPIKEGPLPAFAFAGFQWPRFVAALPQGSKAKRLARYKALVCGPTFHAPIPVVGSNHCIGFYLAGDDMPALRWAWCDEVFGMGRAINHTGWFTDEHGDGEKIRGVVFTLTHGRGYLAGWSMGHGMASGLECYVYADATSAAYAADSAAQFLAEVERDNNANNADEGE